MLKIKLQIGALGPRRPAMKAARVVLLVLLPLGGLVPSAYARDPSIGLSIQFGSPAYIEPPAVYYPPPPVYYGPPPSYYVPRVERRVVIVPDDDYRYYRHDNGRHRGWYKHKHRHDD